MALTFAVIIDGLKFFVKTGMSKAGKDINNFLHTENNKKMDTQNLLNLLQIKARRTLLKRAYYGDYTAEQSERIDRQLNELIKFEYKRIKSDYNIESGGNWL